jgi:hypothetical protein
MLIGLVTAVATTVAAAVRAGTVVVGGVVVGGVVVGGAGAATYGRLVNGRTSQALTTALQAVPAHLLIHGARAGAELVESAEHAWANHVPVPQRGVAAKVEQRTTTALTQRGMSPDLAAHVANWATVLQKGASKP